MVIQNGLISIHEYNKVGSHVQLKKSVSIHVPQKI